MRTRPVSEITGGARRTRSWLGAVVVTLVFAAFLARETSVAEHR